MLSVTFSEDDAAAELLTMLTALDQTGALTAYQEAVVESVMEGVWQALPDTYVEVVDEEAAELAEKLNSR